jgi:hypothetical protein
MLLLINLPPADSAPLADYLPYLNLLRELLREHANQILPHPITISVKSGHLVLLKDLQPSPLGLQWTSPQAQWDPPVAAPLKKQKYRERSWRTLEIV